MSVRTFGMRSKVLGKARNQSAVSCRTHCLEVPTVAREAMTEDVSAGVMACRQPSLQAWTTLLVQTSQRRRRNSSRDGSPVAWRPFAAW